jgi:hypothetical protein
MCASKKIVIFYLLKINHILAGNVSSFFTGVFDMGRAYSVLVRYHCGGWPEEVNSCFFNSYMVYL